VVIAEKEFVGLVVLQVFVRETKKQASFRRECAIPRRPRRRSPPSCSLMCIENLVFPERRAELIIDFLTYKSHCAMLASSGAPSCVAEGKLCDSEQAVYRWQAVHRWRAVWQWASLGVWAWGVWAECQNLPLTMLWRVLSDQMKIERKI
jgi:hypothetical protein